MISSDERVLVTGGSGYIGSRLCDHFAGLGFDVRRLTRHDDLRRQDKILDLTGDICEVDVWDRFANEVDVVIHLAAQTSTYVANDDPIADLAINVQPFLNLLESCRRLERKPFIVLASAVTVVGVTNQTPVSEDDVCTPVTVYDLHKLMAEEYLETYCRLGHARGTTLRLSNVYGPGHAVGSRDRGVLNSMIKRALMGSTLTVYGQGEFLRDYVYIEDVLRAFEAALRHQSETNGLHWVVATGKSYSIREAFEMIRDRAESCTGNRVAIETVQPDYELSPIESRNFVADINGFRAATGWAPAVTLSEGIAQTIKAFEKEAVVAN